MKIVFYNDNKFSKDKDDTIYLQLNNWNDYGAQIAFNADVNLNGITYSLGLVRIVYVEQNFKIEKQNLEINDHFRTIEKLNSIYGDNKELTFIDIIKENEYSLELENLPDECYSLGQYSSRKNTYNYYQYLSEIPNLDAIKILEELRDFAFMYPEIDFDYQNSTHSNKFFRDTSLTEVTNELRFYMFENNLLRDDSIKDINNARQKQIEIKISNEVKYSEYRDFSLKIGIEKRTEFAPQRVVGIIAPNGMGKSRLLKSIRDSAVIDLPDTYQWSGIGNPFNNIIYISSSPFEEQSDLDIPDNISYAEILISNNYYNFEQNIIMNLIEIIQFGTEFEKVFSLLRSLQNLLPSNNIFVNYFEKIISFSTIDDQGQREFGIDVIKKSINIFYRAYSDLLNHNIPNNTFNTLETRKKIESFVNNHVDEIEELINKIADDYGIDAIQHEFSIEFLKILPIFNNQSSGQKFILSSLISIVANMKPGTLIIFDEPENFLHPPMQANYINSISNLVDKYQGNAIIATHSPIIVQEIPHDRMFHLSENERGAKILENIGIRTYGENVSIITREIFGLELEQSGFRKNIDEFATARKLNPLVNIAQMNEILGLEGRLVLAARLEKDLEG